MVGCGRARACWEGVNGGGVGPVWRIGPERLEWAGGWWDWAIGVPLVSFIMKLFTLFDTY